MSSDYSMRDVVRLSGLGRGIVLRLAKAGIVAPERSEGREYRFGFRDLIVLRTARSLYAANVPPRRVTAALRRLRAELPGTLPISGLRVSARGCEVVVREGAALRHVDSGQLLLDFDARPAVTGETVFVERPVAAASEAARHFELGCRLEDEDPDEAARRYRLAIECDAGALNAYVNLGCLLHANHAWDEAESVYRQGLDACAAPAVLHYNLAILQEDRGSIADALASYEAALREDPALADAHFNVARLYAALGRRQEALRAYNAYRRLGREPEP